MFKDIVNVIASYVKNPKGTEALVIKLEHESAVRFFQGQRIEIQNNMVVLSPNQAKQIYVRLYDVAGELKRREKLLKLRQKNIRAFFDETN